MWWLLPWLLFLACIGGVAVSYLLWRRRADQQAPPSLVNTHDLTEIR